MPIIKSNNQQEASTAKIAVWYLISTLLVNGLGVISAPIFTRIISKEDYGLFSNYLAIENLLLAIVSLQLHASIPRAKYDFKKNMDQYISTLILASNSFGILLFILVEAMPEFFSQMLSIEIAYLRILLLSLLFAPTFLYLQAKHRIYKKYKMFTALSITTALLRTSIAIVLVVFMQNKIFGRIVGHVFPIMLINFILWSSAIYKGRGFDLKAFKYAAVISLPVIPHALANNLLSSSDTILITKICGSDKTALYTLAYTISSLVNSIWTAMNQAWTPWMYDKLQEEKRGEVKDKSILYVAVFIMILLPVVLFAPELILIFGGEAYQEAKYVVPPVVVGFLAQMIYGLYVNVEMYLKKTAMISIGTLGAAAINILLNIVLIPRFGYLAAAYTTLIGYCCLMVFHYWRVCVLREYKHLFANRKLFIILISVFASTLIMMKLYDYSYVRYFLFMMYLAALATVCARYRKRGYTRAKKG